jgi:hypothetical protein
VWDSNSCLGWSCECSDPFTFFRKSLYKGSEHKSNRSWLNVQPCFTLLLSAIFSAQVPYSSIVEIAPVYMLVTNFTIHWGKPLQFIAERMSLCRTDGKVFVRSIATTIKSALFLRASCILRRASVRSLGCHLHCIHLFLLWIFSVHPSIKVPSSSAVESLAPSGSLTFDMHNLWWRLAPIVLLFSVCLFVEKHGLRFFPWFWDSACLNACLNMDFLGVNA